MIICGRKQIKNVLERLSPEKPFLHFLKTNHCQTFFPPCRQILIPFFLDFHFPCFFFIFPQLLIKLSTFSPTFYCPSSFQLWFFPTGVGVHDPTIFTSWLKRSKHFERQSTDWLNFNDFYCLVYFACSHGTSIRNQIQFSTELHPNKYFDITAKSSVNRRETTRRSHARTACLFKLN